MSNADVVKEMKTLHVQASEIPNDSKLTPLEDDGWKIEDWSKEFHGVAAAGYLADDSPLQFFNRHGVNWSLMVVPRDAESPFKKFLWVLAINKTAGARNFLLQVLQDHPDIAFVMFGNYDFQRILDELDYSLPCFKENRMGINVSSGISIIEQALLHQSKVTVNSIEEMIRK